MLTRLAQTLCRLFAAFVCLLCASEVFGFSPAPVRGESALSAADQSDDLDATSEAPDSRDEREERAGDDEDDDIDDSHHVPWSAPPTPQRVSARPAFPRAMTQEAARASHLSLDPRPPRRA